MARPLFSQDSPQRQTARPRNGRSAQEMGEELAIDEALNPPAVTPPAINRPPSGGQAPTDQPTASTPPMYSNTGFSSSGGILPTGSDHPLTNAPLSASGSFTRPSGLGSYAGNLEGFNMDRFADPSGRGNDTWKYRVGSVLSQYAPNAEGLGQAAQYLQGQGVDVKQGGTKGDLLEFGGGITDEFGNAIGTIDVGRGFGAGGSGWAWQPQGAMDGTAVGGAGGSDLNSAFSALQGMVPLNASKEQMEQAITQAFGNVPGFQGAYKESVNINGQWYDLVGGYGGASPSWQLMPKTEHGPAAATGFNLGSLGSGGLSTGNVPGLQTGGNDYTSQILQYLLQDLGI